MSIHGFGLGASVVGGFSDAHKSAIKVGWGDKRGKWETAPSISSYDDHKSTIKAGFPDTIDTYGLVSGLWTSVFAFGAFVGKRENITSSQFSSLNLSTCSGPTFGGILFDAVTFRWAIFLVIIGELISLVMLISYLCIELCGASPPSPPASVASDTDQVNYISLFARVIYLDISFLQLPSLPTIGEGYGTTSSTIGARMRKYSESVGRSYVASSVARWLQHLKILTI